MAPRLQPLARQRLLLLIAASCFFTHLAAAFLHATSQVPCCQGRIARVGVTSRARSAAHPRKYRRRTICRDRAVCSSGMNAVSSRIEQHHEGGDSEDQLAPAAAASDGAGETAATARGIEDADASAGESSSSEERARGLWGWRRKRRRREGGEEEEGDEEVEEREQKEIAQDKEKQGAFTYDWDNGSRIVWAASKNSSVEVEEGGRRLKDYLALPPTEYSLLDPKMITRLSEETFRMDGATMNIVGTKVKPVIFVKVEVQPEQSMANIMVERVELDGSDAVRGAGGTFNVSSSTVVSCAEKEGPGRANLMDLRVASGIEIELLVPNENFVPLGVLRRAGNFVMQRIVDIGVPQFTKFLKRDYARWAEGNDDRAAVVLEGETLIDPGDV